MANLLSWLAKISEIENFCTSSSRFSSMLLHIAQISTVLCSFIILSFRRARVLGLAGAIRALLNGQRVLNSSRPVIESMGEMTNLVVTEYYTRLLGQRWKTFYLFKFDEITPYDWHTLVDASLF